MEFVQPVRFVERIFWAWYTQDLSSLSMLTILLIGIVVHENFYYQALTHGLFEIPWNDFNKKA